MAKNVIICLLFVGLIGSLVFGLFQRSTINDHQRATILAEQDRKQAREAQDRAESDLKEVRDSLETAMIVMMNAKIDAEKAKIETQEAKKQYESILFKRFDSDSLRESELKRLYKSY